MYTVYQLLAADDKVPRGIFLLLYREDTARETHMAPEKMPTLPVEWEPFLSASTLVVGGGNEINKE